MSDTFFGKYRGEVTDNADPDGLGRIRATVPDVLGDEESGWAMPCLPYAGPGVGLFVLPPTGASVWIEFEQGDPEYPIWSGCFWRQGRDLPVSPATEEQKMLKTDTHTLLLKDQPSEVLLETEAGMKITIDSGGIEIDNGRGAVVTLEGNKVSVNQGALEVT